LPKALAVADDDRVALGDLRHGGREALGDVVLERGVVRDEDLVRAESLQLFGCAGAGADHEDRERAAESLRGRARERDSAVGGLLELAFGASATTSTFAMICVSLRVRS
jgi:phosphoglycerate dehydrogenase-like enzyme